MSNIEVKAEQLILQKPTPRACYPLLGLDPFHLHSLAARGQLVLEEYGLSMSAQQKEMNKYHTDGVCLEERTGWRRSLCRWTKI